MARQFDKLIALSRVEGQAHHPERSRRIEPRGLHECDLYENLLYKSKITDQ